MMPPSYNVPAWSSGSHSGSGFYCPECETTGEENFERFSNETPERTESGLRCLNCNRETVTVIESIYNYNMNYKMAVDGRLSAPNDIFYLDNAGDVVSGGTLSADPSHEKGFWTSSVFKKKKKP